MQANLNEKHRISIIEEERKISKEQSSFEPPDGGWGWAVCAACFYSCRTCSAWDVCESCSENPYDYIY